jgi:hypothetical protein
LGHIVCNGQEEKELVDGHIAMLTNETAEA